MSSTYQKLIIQATKCSASDAVMVEDIMRNEIFQSTLDWQSQEEFRQGAQKAYTQLQANRSDYEEYFRQTKLLFAKQSQ